MVYNQKKKKRSIILKIFIIFILIFHYSTHNVFAFLSKKEEAKYWQLFKKYFLTYEQHNLAYINDDFYSNATHSEAQSVGLYLSVYFNDKKTFYNIWAWTKKNLQVRKSDHLFAWLWGKDHNGNFTVLDYNNASDADIVIAWSLLLANKKWGDTSLKFEATKIIHDIKNRLIIKNNNSFFLLPGYEGFNKPEAIIVNPSYYIIPAIIEFYKITNDQLWINLIKDAQSIFGKHQKGKFQLLPDWIYIPKTKCFSSSKSEIFGYESIRFYLYQTMIPNSSFKKKFELFVDFFSKNASWIPDKIDLKKNLVSINDAPAGFYAVFYIANQNKNKLIYKAKEKLKHEKSYYSFSLFLLSNIFYKQYIASQYKSNIKKCMDILQKQRFQ